MDVTVKNEQITFGLLDISFYRVSWCSPFVKLSNIAAKLGPPSPFV